MNFDEKFYNIESLENKKDISEQDILNILILKKDNNAELCSLIAQVLVTLPIDIAEPILLSMAEDTDTFVRINVCDSLCLGRSRETIVKLQEKAAHDISLVRAYAVLSLADIAKNRTEF